MKENKSKYSIQVLDRLVQILDCFTLDKPKLQFTELQSKLDLHKSTLYRLLEAMRAYGLVEHDEKSGQYYLGLRLFQLGMIAVERLEISECATSTLEHLVEQTGETAHLCVLDGSEVVYVAKVESKQTLRMPSNIGRRNPAYCTGVGKAILAHLPEEQLNAYLANTSLQPFTERTVVAAAELRKQLKEVASRGYSVDDEEINEGLRCIGAPVRDYSGDVIASVSIAGPTMRITKSKIPELAKYVIGAAYSLSEELGFHSTKKSIAAR
jgi:DNA-binding IclR family transcriptional regulator